MKLLYSPQVGIEGRTLDYEFDGDMVHITINGHTDSFDFTGYSNDGEVDIFSIETTLPFNPLLEAKRVDGELHLTLLKYIGLDAIEEEKYPDWIEV
jgi:hypothetical protein